MRRNPLLFAAGCMSLMAAVAHLLVIVIGAEAYRFAGAGEAMAQMAAAGSFYPVLVTLVIVAILGCWALYAFAGAGLIRPLPLMQPILWLVTLIYCGRGLLGLLVPFMAMIPDQAYVDSMGPQFWLVSSAISLGMGLLHLAGLWRAGWRFNTGSIIGSQLRSY